IVAQHPRQTVIGNSAREVVDMVHADIGSQPAQDPRQLVMRTSMQGRLLKCPLAVVCPECHLELVLHVEQPYSDRAREKHNWEVHEQERSDADEPDQAGGDQAIAKFVAMVLSQGCQPLRNSPTGSRYFRINRYAGPMPNMTLGCR